MATGRVPAPPRYGRRSLAELLPAVLQRLAQHVDDGSSDDTDGATGSGASAAAGGSVSADLADLPQRVVVLVADGLGSRLLDEHAAAAPTLTAAHGTDVDAVFPSTTVTSITSIGTGLPASQHGLVGYAWPVPDHHQPLNGLGWRVGLRGGGRDARTSHVPEAHQPRPTCLERAAAAGIAATVVVDPDHLDSGLTRAALRGGERRGAHGLSTTLATALEVASAGDAPALVYAHDPAIDRAGHEFGPHATETRDAVADLDRALRDVLGALPPDVAVLVTADHGMLDVPDDHVVELADLPALATDVRVLAGEPRVRQVALVESADVDEVAGRWQQVLGDRATVLTRDQALPLFGPDPDPRAAASVGDLVVLARGGTALVHERVDPHGGRMRGQHGGLTATERLVPLRRLTRRS